MLEIANRDESGAAVFAVSGEIDAKSAPQLRTALAGITDAPGSPARDLVLDLEAVDFLDSSALGVLVGVEKRFDGAQTRFSIVCDKPHLLRVFQITRLDSVLRIVPTLDAALA